jgi:hypothetical protein
MNGGEEVSGIFQPALPYPSGGRAFSYCFGAACRDDLAEQGVFRSFCAFKKDNKPKDRRNGKKDFGFEASWLQTRNMSFERFSLSYLA